jgi:hypothetical protein
MTKYHVRSPRGGKFSSFPASIRTISNYVRSVSANASSIAASTVREVAVAALPVDRSIIGYPPKHNCQGWWYDAENEVHAADVLV